MVIRSLRRARRPTFNQTSEPALVEIISTDAELLLNYEFFVDGTVEPAEGRDPDISSIGEIGINDFITVREDGTVHVEGETGNLFGDAYMVSGEILLFSKTGGGSGYQVFINGVDVTGDPTGPVNPPVMPEIPVPAEDTCDGHVSAAQDYSDAVRAEGFTCDDFGVDMICPFDEFYVYHATNGCEIRALKSYGWTQPKVQPPKPDIPAPVEDTCDSHIATAQQFENDVIAAGYECTSEDVDLLCPIDETTVYNSTSRCQTNALKSYGWTVYTPPPPPDEPPEEDPIISPGAALGIAVVGLGAASYFLGKG